MYNSYHMSRIRMYLKKITNTSKPHYFEIELLSLSKGIIFPNCVTNVVLLLYQCVCLSFTITFLSDTCL